MENNFFSPEHLKQTVFQLLHDDNRNLAWKIIDHFFEKSYNIQHYDILGYLSLKAEKRETYLKCAERAYSLCENPQQISDGRKNLYKAYSTLNRPEDALFYIEKELLLNPEDFDTLCHKATNTSLLGRKDESIKFLSELKEKYPHKNHEIDSLLSTKYLREGNLSKGILFFVESFKKKNYFFEEQMAMQKWDGTKDAGKTVYVDIEGGTGDQIINIRFLDVIKSWGMKPILVSHNTDYYKDVNKLFVRHGYEVLTDKLMIDRSQYWAPMMSLPAYMKLEEKDLWQGPYIRPLRKDKNKLVGHRPKIGIKCSGNPFFAQDEYRKIPIEIMVNQLKDIGDLYYIDKEKCEHEGVVDLSDKINSWEDTLDLIDQMDCIVSSCTSLVHAAAAMGKTTFVAVPIAEYYIWTTSKLDGSSPWYGDNLYVARQTTVRDWTEPLNDIKNRVKKLFNIT
jgi:tetratricopeptide (TPR) repeat protein